MNTDKNIADLKLPRGDFWKGNRLAIFSGHVISKLPEIPEGSVQCVVTSPPYWGLRSYLPKGHPLKHLEIGQEKTPAKFVERMLEIFGGKENPVGIWRVLREDGTVWLNLGDCYAGSGRGIGDTKSNNKNNSASRDFHDSTVESMAIGRSWVKAPAGYKQKDLIGIPWRVALALQAAGWYLRSDIIWAKPNCMPESVTDRPTRSHEYLFLLTKSPRYFYDAEAIKEPCIYEVSANGDSAKRSENHQAFTRDHPERAEASKFINGGYKNSVNFDGKNKGNDKQRGHSRRHDGFNSRWDAMEKDEQCTGMRNKRDVWTISPANYPEAHFATFPPELIKPCILAGTSAGGACAECGAPLQRKTEKGAANLAHQQACGGDARGEYDGTSTKGHAAHGVQDASAVKARILEGMRETKTIGWEPPCKCQQVSTPHPNPSPRSSGGEGGRIETVPCVVLDPFGGSGTTGEVALELGRRAILIELNPEYLPLIDRRTNITPGLAI